VSQRRDFIDRVLVHDLRRRCVIVARISLRAQPRGQSRSPQAVGEVHGLTLSRRRLTRRREMDSSAVRRALGSGDLVEVRRILGRPFVLHGLVEHGDNRGEALGFPTANLSVAKEQALPAEGVYAGATILEVRVAGRDFSRHPAAVLRRRRVIGGSPPGGLRGQLYGRALDVCF